MDEHMAARGARAPFGGNATFAPHILVVLGLHSVQVGLLHRNDLHASGAGSVALQQLRIGGQEAVSPACHQYRTGIWYRSQGLQT